MGRDPGEVRDDSCLNGLEQGLLLVPRQLNVAKVDAEMAYGRHDLTHV